MTLIAAHAGLLTPSRTLASLTLWPAFATYEQPYLMVGWSLSFELLFYLGAALVLKWPKAA